MFGFFKDRYSRGYDRFCDGNYDDAIKEFTLYIEAMEAKGYELSAKEIQKLAESYNFRGRAYCIKDNYGEAISDFAKCIKYGRKNAEDYRLHARSIHKWLSHYCNGNDEKIKKAIKAITLDLTKCIELGGGKNIDDYYWRGHFYHCQNNFDVAIEDFTKCINMILEKEKEKTEIAVKDLRKVIESNDNCKIEYYYHRGLSYFGKNNYDVAIEDFTKAIELSCEEHVNSYYWRSYAYYESKNYSAALEDINNALEISPDFESAKKLKWEIIRACPKICVNGIFKIILFNAQPSFNSQ